MTVTPECDPTLHSHHGQDQPSRSCPGCGHLVERPEYEMFDFEAAAKALKKILKQRKKGKPLKWTGPDNLHHAILATCFPPSEVFTEEYLKYDREDQGRDFWDAFIMVAFQLGFHDGYVRAEADNAVYKRLATDPLWKRATDA